MPLRTPSRIPYGTITSGPGTNPASTRLVASSSSIALNRKRGGTVRIRAPVVRFAPADAAPNQTNASAASARETPPSPRIEKWWNTSPVPNADAKVRPATNSQKVMVLRASGRE